MTITATWNPTSYTYTLTTALTGTVSWWRTVVWPDGRTLGLSLGTGNPVTDTTVPLNGGLVTWYANNGTTQEQLSLTPPSPAGPILSVPSDPGLPAAMVTVLTQREWTVRGRAYLYEVLDRNTPWVEPMPPIERTGELVLRLEHPDHQAFPGTVLARVRNMLRTGKPMLLRTVCHTRVETISFIPLDWTETHLGEPNVHGPDRTATITWQAVEPLYGDDIKVAGRLWWQVPVEFGTWDQLRATGLTWDELAAGVLP
jgi:hypothetical protein